MKRRPLSWQEDRKAEEEAEQAYLAELEEEERSFEEEFIP